jgi:large subunit ribosomal protein L10
MSKAVKALITRELTDKLKGVGSMVVCSTVGLTGKDDNSLRRALHGKNVRLMVVKNSLAKLALHGLGITTLDPLLEGPTALAWGSAGVEIRDVAAELVGFAKKYPKLQIRGGLVDGEKIDAAGVMTVASGPGRRELIAGIVAQLMGPGGRLVAQLRGPGGHLAAQIKEIGKAPAGQTAPADGQ